MLEHRLIASVIISSVVVMKLLLAPLLASVAAATLPGHDNPFWYNDDHHNSPQGANFHQTLCRSSNKTLLYDPRNSFGGQGPAPSPQWVTAMENCYDQYDNTTWVNQKQDCNGLGWYQTSEVYKSQTDCHNACSACFSELFNMNAQDGSCWDVYGMNLASPGGSNPPGKYTGCKLWYEKDAPAKRARSFMA